MSAYAPQSYYDEIVALFVASGFDFLLQVQINTDDLPYHVPIDKAQETSLVFYTKGKNCILRFVHSESRSLDGEWLRYWQLALDVELASQEMLHASLGQRAMQRQPRDGEYERIEFKPQFDTFCHCGWSSRYQLQYRWNVEGTYEPELTPKQIHDSVVPVINTGIVPYLASSPMPELHVDWAPTYTFSDPEQHRNDKEKQACRNLYWSRVTPEAFKIIRTLVKRIT